MAEAIYGKDHILAFRLWEDRNKKNAIKLALQTQHSWKYESKSDSTETKDGAINSPATATVSLDIEAVASLDDVNTFLLNAVKQSKKLEVWDVNLADLREDGKYGAQYAQGYLQSWEVPAEVGKLTQIKTSMNIDQLPQDGAATFTTDQQDEIQYAFTDTTPVAGDGGSSK
ncbi:putative phage tail protein [Weissella oryzae SG25]|uniref:Putative phage tail protein n=1 Tax=Weissella oryzae (strain DSM 25784 / JCM 18191 / LMG 30913 / SG25) TaxID=1329250 RepID=A0A069CT70_WEIOS|nr:phage major tail protein, TP901-1 family [Weissella oryzae]GAK31005.1 putative phage tail protein [Weissella oryzae SG25]